MPDISLLPALADYFDVSIDYLLRGENTTKGDFLKAVTDRVIAHGYDDGYGEFLTVAAAAFRGIHAGNLRGCGVPCFAFHGDTGGLAGLDLRGAEDGFVFGITRNWFTHMDMETTAAELAALSSALDSKEKCLVLLAALSMDDVSIHELPELLGMTGLSEDTVSAAVESLARDGILTTQTSKHKALGVTCHVHEMRYPALVLLAAAAAVSRKALKDGFSCCLGPGDFPIGRP